jgi:hypothetical protein
MTAVEVECYKKDHDTVQLTSEGGPKKRLTFVTTFDHSIFCDATFSIENDCLYDIKITKYYKKNIKEEILPENYYFFLTEMHIHHFYPHLEEHMILIDDIWSRI